MRSEGDVKAFITRLLKAQQAVFAVPSPRGSKNWIHLLELHLTCLV